MGGIGYQGGFQWYLRNSNLNLNTQRVLRRHRQKHDRQCTITNIAARGRNGGTSSVILRVWDHFTRRKRFYDNLMSPATRTRT